MATNDTIIPSPSDLLMVVPRLARKMASLAAALLPDQVESVMAEFKNQGSIIADATSSAVENATATFVQQSTASEAAAAATASASQGGFLSYFTMPFSPDGIRGFGGMFAYIGSRWALSTFAISIFLNRTQFYASSRQNLNIRWHTRLLLYSAPTFLLLLQAFWILQTMKCQTSPLYPQLRYGDPRKRLAINFGGDGGSLYNMASTLLFWKDDAECCQAMHMSLIDNNKLDVMGSFSLLWPLFLTLCFSQFTETLYCALQGRQPLPETGMTTFEHSLAFAECEAMITNAVGLGFLSSSKSSPTTKTNSSEPSDSSAVLLTKSMIMRRLNVPSEVLLIALISCLSHLSSSLLVITGHRNQLRLVNTAIWAFCYMAAFCWSFVKTLNSPMDPDDLGILRFPTVCIIGFIPHMLVLVGIFVCSIIYGLALLVTALSLPATAPPNPSLKERFSLAFHNMQANVQFSSASPIRLNWHEDFYTVLLKIGFNVLTAASEAVYLNEGSRIQIHSMTWLEEERIQDLAAMAEHRRRFDLIPAELLEERIAKGLSFTDHQNVPSRSGFATERKSKSANETANGRATGSDSGLGIAERRGRWQLSFDFIKGMMFLFSRILSRLLLSLLSTCGIERIPAWLRRAADYRQGTVATTKSRKMHRAQTPDFWLVSDNGVLSLPENGDIDVEVEMRRRLRAQSSGGDPTEDAIEEDLYGWWKRGGWWGDLDTSGDYEAHDQDDDTTSMISMSTNAASEAGSDEEDSGRRTPTQEDYMVARREETPETGFGMSDLARLLDPKTTADKEEAQMLSRRLQSERPMTRAQYRRRADREKARILDVPHIEPAFGERREGSMTKTEEAEALERFLLERRAATHHGQSGQGGSWDSGAEGMGSSGPQCVVCQCSPRVIVAWPCGCLCVCDECRIGVATRNFTKCMCCRTKVVAYSRLYVP